MALLAALRECCAANTKAAHLIRSCSLPQPPLLHDVLSKLLQAALVYKDRHERECMLECIKFCRRRIGQHFVLTEWCTALCAVQYELKHCKAIAPWSQQSISAESLGESSAADIVLTDEIIHAAWTLADM